MNKVVEVSVNAPFDLNNFNKNKTEYDKKCLNKILERNNVLSIFPNDLNDKKKFDVILINKDIAPVSIDNDSNEAKNPILKINRINNNDIQISTSRYIGVLCFKNGIVKIDSGYSSFFTKRMLNFSNNIYVDNSADYATSDEDDLLILLQYLFLSTLKRASILGLPKKYFRIKNQDFCIKGKIDFNSYIKNMKNIYKGVPYHYKRRDYCPEIIDVIYCAIQLCNRSYLVNNFDELLPVMKEIKQYYSGIVPNIGTINKAKRSPVLNNEMYSLYKKVLAYAEILLLNKGFMPSHENDKQVARGWLIDVYELWELYLYNVLKKEFPDWLVVYQEEIPFYLGKTFYSREFRPDIIMRKGNQIVIVDAKFKKMDFSGGDVDRNDLQQIHTYYGYYLSKNCDIKLATLVYPARGDIPSYRNSFANIFDGTSKTKFGVSYIKIGNSVEEQIANEKAFVSRLGDYLL